MTKSKGIGRGKHNNHVGGGKNDQFGKDSPTYYLRKYKTTQRPVPCERCGQNAYYKHPEWGNVCAAHLLDLICIWEAKIDWNEYPEMWERTERLLKRPLPTELSTTVKNMDAIQHSPVDKPKKSDG